LGKINAIQGGKMEDTKEIIIKTAKQMFGKYGMKKTTVGEIAKQARLGKGTIYHYFETKEDILETVVREDLGSLKNEIEEAIKKETSPDKKLRAYILTRMKVMNRFANLFSTFKKEYIEYYASVQKIYSNYSDNEVATIRGILKEGVDKNLFNIKDIDLVVFTLTVNMKTMEYYWATEKQEDMEKKLDVMLNVLFYGLYKR
jgi:AcrR family transcriptional regulator